MSSPPVALTIAGSDSGGAAGIAADLTTFAALGVHGCVAVAAVTAQNTAEVVRIEAMDPGLVDDQIRTVVADLPVAATKTGMLATAGIIEMVIAAVDDDLLPNLVVDPVLVSSTGAALFEPDAERAYRTLLARATVATPNLGEASRLVGADLETVDDIRAHADALAALVPAGHVVVTGGHLLDEGPVDIVIAGVDVDSVDGSRIVAELTGDLVATANDHGTGCTFAAATAARLAHGDLVLEAVARAKEFVAGRLHDSAGWQLGQGHGPVSHRFVGR